MRLRRFEGTTVAEALARVRADLGTEAVILHTRSLEEPSPHGKRGGWVEVTAAVDAPPDGGDHSGAEPRWAAAAGSRIAGGAPITPPCSQTPGFPEQGEEASDRLDAIHRLLLDLQAGQAPTAGIPARWQGVYRKLCRQEVPAAVARRLVLSLRKDEERTAGRDPFGPSLEMSLARAFRTQRRTAAGREPRVIVLVGPTGVGKTTTIAKLAGQARRDAGLDVALMTLDTYRIGAVTQMRIYADLLGAPLHVAHKPDELASAVAAQRTDLILVDTVGRSPQHREGIQALESFLKAVPRAEVHLVLSATTKRSDLEETLRRFRPLHFRFALITKLDEARRLGPVLASVLEHELPVSYLTTGQEVPDDLEEATSHRLARWLMTPYTPEDARAAARA